MFNEQQKQIMQNAIDVYGKHHQIDKAIEEMAELTKELIKRKQGHINRKQVVEELADVYIMLEQIRLIHDVNCLELKQAEEFKINRLADNLEFHKTIPEICKEDEKI